MVCSLGKQPSDQLISGFDPELNRMMAELAPSASIRLLSSRRRGVGRQWPLHFAATRVCSVGSRESSVVTVQRIVFLLLVRIVSIGMGIEVDGDLDRV